MMPRNTRLLRKCFSFSHPFPPFSMGLNSMRVEKEGGIDRRGANDLGITIKFSRL
jgi:hypothetical protein